MTCKKLKQIGKDQITAPNDKMGEEVLFQFHNIFIDHKGPRSIMKVGKHRRLFVTDAFSTFFQVCPVKSSDATHYRSYDNLRIFFLGFFKNFFMIEEQPSRLLYSRILPA